MESEPPPYRAGVALVVLAAGAGSRFGGAKHLASVGPAGESLLDYAIYDAVRAGADRVAIVVREGGDPALAAHVTDTVAGAVPVVPVEQRLGDLPGGRRPPAGRSKPWGTAHAVLAARTAVAGPFLACNADDYYGPGAFRALIDHLRSGSHGSALAGYRLDQTLSAHGGVSRAVAATGAGGGLAGLEEMLDIRRDPESGRLVGRGADGRRSVLTGAEPVSMNLWGFAPTAWRVLDRAFEEFLAASGTDPGAEFQLSQAIGAAVTAGRLQVRVLPAPDRWLGLTFAADLPAVRDAIAGLVAAGRYPPDLRAAFRAL